jgi:F-type H+-transporting ATPase subunit b
MRPASVSRWLAAATLAAAFSVSSVGLVLAQDGHDPHAAGEAAPPPPGARKAVMRPGGPRPMVSANLGRNRTAPTGHDAHGEHGEHGEVLGATHLKPGEHESHETKPINWMYGLIGEKEGVEPGLVWRPKGMPAPFLALLINFGILIGLGIRFAKKPIVDGVKDRKKNIMRDIDEATKTKAAAKKRYNEYKKKLDSIDEEVERIRGEYAEQAEREKERILSDAEAGRIRLTKDAEFVLAQERKQLQQDLLVETVARATKGAEDLLRQRLGQSDQDRLAEDFLSNLGSSLGPAAPRRSTTGGAS